MKRQRSANIACYLQQREAGYNRSPVNPAMVLAEEKATLPNKNLPCELSGQTRSTFLVSYSPDGSKMASTHGDHTVRVTEMQSGKCTHILTGHPRTPWCIAFHPSSNDILASGCLGGQVRIWDLRGGGSEVWRADQNVSITSLAFHPIDQVLVIALVNQLLFWDWTQPKPFAQCKTVHTYEKVRWVKFDPVGHWLYTGIANCSTVHADDCDVGFIGDIDHRSSDERAHLRHQYQQILDEIALRQRDRIHPPAPSTSSSTPTPGLRGQSLESAFEPVISEPVGSSLVEPDRPPSLVHVDALYNARQYAHLTTQAINNARAYAASVTGVSTVGSSVTPTTTLNSFGPRVADPVPIPLEADPTLPRQPDPRIDPATVPVTDNNSNFIMPPVSNPMTSVSLPVPRPPATRIRGSTGSFSFDRLIRSQLGHSQRLSEVVTTTSASVTVTSSSRHPTSRSLSFHENAAIGAVTVVAGSPTSRPFPATTTASSLSAASGAASTSTVGRQLGFFSQNPVSSASVSLAGGAGNSNELRSQLLGSTGSTASITSVTSSSQRSYIPRSRLNTSLLLPAPLISSVPSTSSTLPATGTSSWLQSFVTSASSVAVPSSLSAALSSSPPSSSPSVSHTSASSVLSHASCPDNCEICRRYPLGSSPPQPSVPVVPSRVSRSIGASSGLLGSSRVHQPHSLASIIENEVRQTLDQVRARRLDISETLRDLDQLRQELETSDQEAANTLTGDATASRLPDPAPTGTPSSEASGSSSMAMWEGSSELDDNMEVYSSATEPAADGDVLLSSPAAGDVDMDDVGDGQGGDATLRSIGAYSVQLENRVNELDQRVSEIQNRLNDRMRELSSLRHRHMAQSRTLQSSVNERRRERLTRMRAHLDNLRQRYTGLSQDGATGQSTRPERGGSERVRRLRAAHDNIRRIRDDARQRQPDDSSRAWHRLQRRNVHPHYSTSILDDTINSQNQGLQAAVNRVITGAYLAVGGDNLVPNFMTQTHRIQQWDFSHCRIPNIADSEASIVVPHCKIHNDANCDISDDGKLLATFVPSHQGFPEDTILTVYSLVPDTLGQSLFTKSFGPNAVSLSLSPLNNYVLVGLASKRVTWTFTAKQMVAQVYKLQTPKAGEESMEHVCDVMHPCDANIRAPVSINSARWMPGVGEGMVYATNRGDLHIYRPGFEQEDKRVPSSVGGEGEGNTLRRSLMQMLGLTVPRTISIATQTIQRVRRTTSTQTDQAQSLDHFYS